IEIPRGARKNVRNEEEPHCALLQCRCLGCFRICHLSNQTANVMRLEVLNMCIAQATDIFAAGLVADAFVMGTFAVLPAAARLDASPHVLLRQHLVRRLSTFMPPLMLLPIAASIAALTVCRARLLGRSS